MKAVSFIRIKNEEHMDDFRLEYLIGSFSICFLYSAGEQKKK